MADPAFMQRLPMGRFVLSFLLSSRGLHVGAVVLIVLYLWPYWALRQDAHILVHDQLDSVFISLKILAESGLLFAHPDTPIPAIGNDFPRVAYPSPFYGVVWLFELFGSFNGYVAAQLILRLIAYWGMYRLLSQHYLTAEGNRFPVVLSSLAFACLPHYSLFGLSIAGQPLLFSSLLAIRAGRDNPVDWTVSALYPMWSLPALGGLFTLLVGGMIWCRDFLMRHSGAQRLFWALSVAIAMMLVVEYQMVMVILGLADGFVSHRTEFRLNTPEFSTAIANAWYNFKDGQYHAPSLQGAVILPGAVGAMILATGRYGIILWRTGAAKRWLSAQSVAATLTVVAFLLLLVVIMRESTRMSPVVLEAGVVALWVLMFTTTLILARHSAIPGYEDELQRPVVLLMSSLTVALAFSLWYGVWPLIWASISAVDPNIPFLNLSRFHYLHPMLWSMVLAAVLVVLWSQGRLIGVFSVALVVALQGTNLFRASEHRQAALVGDPTFREYFSPELFNNLKQALGPNERISGIVSVGLHPAIAAYNGMRTLDGYLANYPLTYKRSFRRLIAGELERDQSYQRYFDDWGSRFYIFYHELALAGDFAFALTKKRVLEKDIRLGMLRFNTQAFTLMGGSHVLSAVPIGNANEIGLELAAEAEHPASPWHLYLYRVAGKIASPYLP